MGDERHRRGGHLARHIEAGGNFIDTAYVYTYGHSEKIIGDYVAGRSGLRDRLVLATKFFCNQYRNDPNSGGASRKAITARRRPCPPTWRCAP
ncbi:aldo/keto reductase [Streptomyces sp. NPDC058385]|uniref:aldo/keto reductase n=1 Tax=Streptomyces sp. NPDC058385 TaxID=3346473 RepID=UPI00364CD579